MTSFTPFNKLTPPNLPNDLIDRPHLESVLFKGLEEKARLFLVIAPAGYGKTSLLANWVNKNQIENIWINLDESDNDPYHLLAIIQQALDERSIGSSEKSETTEDIEQIINQISNRVHSVRRTVLLIFDKFETIKNNDVQDIIYSLCISLPDNVSTVLLSRKNPALSISRMRAHKQLVEINEQDLSFSLDETRQFIDSNMKLNIQPNNLEAVYKKTLGWAAGLRLAIDVLGTQLETENNLAISKFNGGHPYLADYFNEEVFSRLDKDSKNFLLNTCMLDQFSAPLCNAILEIREPEEIINFLIENHLFTYEIKFKPHWIEYHPLFRDFLVSQNRQVKNKDIIRKAALWFQFQGNAELAVDYGFRSGDEQTAFKIVEPACERLMLDGNIETISNWLERWTRCGFQNRGALLAYQGWIHALNGNFVQALVFKEQAEKTLIEESKKKDKENNQHIPITQGKLAALQAFIEVMYAQNYNEAAKQSRKALKLLSNENSAWNLMALWSLAETQKRIDHISKAIDTQYEALRIGKSVGGKIFYYTIVNSLATALHFNGQRTEALEVCQKAIAQSMDADDPSLGGIYAWSGRLYYEANQLDEALDYVQKGIQLNEKVGPSLSLIFAHYYAALIYQALGQSTKAMNAIQYAKQLAGNASLSDEGWLNACEANLNLKQGNLLQVEHWIRREGPALNAKPDYLNMELFIVHTRYLIHKKESNEAAKKLHAMEKFAVKRGYYRWLLTIYILEAIIWQQKDKQPQALDCLKKALSIAVPVDIIHPFLDEDPVYFNLIPELSSESPAFVMRLLRAAASQDKDNLNIPASILPEPLSKRELQVLKLLAAGKRGPQIAKELFIAYSTVRTHIKSIHRKLDVHNRQELLEKTKLLELV